LFRKAISLLIAERCPSERRCGLSGFSTVFENRFRIGSLVGAHKIVERLLVEVFRLWGMQCFHERVVG
jgi:hypothetical protein